MTEVCVIPVKGYSMYRECRLESAQTASCPRPEVVQTKRETFSLYRAAWEPKTQWVPHRRNKGLETQGRQRWKRALWRRLVAWEIQQLKNGYCRALLISEWRPKWIPVQLHSRDETGVTFGGMGRVSVHVVSLVPTERSPLRPPRAHCCLSLSAPLRPLASQSEGTGRHSRWGCGEHWDRRRWKQGSRPYLSPLHPPPTPPMSGCTISSGR